MKKVIAFASAVAILGFASTASAFWGGSDVEVKNYNNAAVANVVVSDSNTGNNTSYGGDAKVKVYGWGNDTNSSTAGNGGSIETGDAASWTYVGNDINSSNTKVSTSCGCKGDVEVKNRNSAEVVNGVSSISNTGFNTTMGGNSYAKVKGMNNDSNSARGGATGSISTGEAYSDTEVVNVLNESVTRVRKGGFSL